MRLLRTAGGDFINAATIRALQRDEDGAAWLAVLADGDEVPLAPYYSAPGRVEQVLPARAAPPP